MDKRKKVLNLIVEQRILPLYHHEDLNVSLKVLKSMYQAGIRVIEYTDRGENTWENFIQLRKVADTELPGLLLGAGTIKNKIHATEFVNEGADFIVCPGVIKEVANLVHYNDLLWIPTCMTTTEIIYAEELGAKLVKLFPGNVLTPLYVNIVKEIFPDLLFMPSGGIELVDESMNAWFTAGASAVGMGSTFISKNLIETGDYAAIESLARNGLALAKKYKPGKN